MRALIIGASSGMGRILARLLAEDGHHVGITGRRKNLLEGLKNTHPGQFHIHSFDCTGLNNTAELDEIARQMGPIELLILCAGNGEINKGLDYEIEHETNLLNVNAFTQIITWAFTYFKQQGKGQIAVITSIAGIRGGRVAPAYNASKAYQIHYLEGLRQRAVKKGLNITITDIRPGFVDTAMAKGGRKFWVVPSEKAARQIYRHILAGRNVAYVSKRWRLIAWVLKILPTYIYKRL